MQAKEKDVTIRFVSNRSSFESSSGHHARTLTERHICEWLTSRNIAHQHGNDVFIVKAAASGSPALFVPDIVLTRRAKSGRAVIIESLHSFSPKRGGLKTLSAFRKQYHDQFSIIIVAKRSILDAIPRTISEGRVELENLDMLEKKIEKLLL